MARLTVRPESSLMDADGMGWFDRAWRLCSCWVAPQSGRGTGGR